MDPISVNRTTPNRRPEWLESLYERLAEDDEGRTCKEISAEACHETPGNFLYTLIANTLSNIADRLASAKTTLPWLLLQLGAPAWMLSLLVPIRESGSMLPQILIGEIVRRQAIRKWVWVWGGVVQGLCLAAIGWAAFALEGAMAGATVIGLLILFSLARGACSVAYKDVQGKTIPKTRRGRLSGWISAIAGLGAMGVGLGLGAVQDASESTGLYVALLAGAALLWFLAAWSFSRIVEFPGATEGGSNALAEAFARLAIMRDDEPFRRFVIARALAMGSGLAAPFYVALARDDLGGAISLLGIFIAVEGLAGLVSSPVWGRWSDHSSRQVFAAACGLAAALSIAVALWSWLGMPSTAAIWFYPIAFFGLGIAHAGVRLGRKTYLVDMADGNKRTDYVAVSNSVIGALLLVSGLLGALAATVSVEATILLLGLAGLAGVTLSLKWKEVSG
ncbi:MFS transporter [Thiocapsa bogorovii]|uniref:MFS transporter n=1 Tax=Thiocapsa bogorovii TaxID=521689 RepID=UPI001E387FD0|nr:MFS transporter [Thiocapsa bogorovii]UHD18390.1 MFS transporter [Thiocapsa bogorovii]